MMRIQETDRVLKESRYARHSAAVHEHEHEGLLSRAWRAVTHLPARVVEMFRK